MHSNDGWTSWRSAKLIKNLKKHQYSVHINNEVIRACERSGAATFPAHRLAPFTGVPLTTPFPLRRPPAPAPLTLH